MKEIWKDIPGYEGLYQVSNLGRIKSFRKDYKHNLGEYILKPYVANSGYCQVTLYRNSKDRKKYLIHRIVASAFIDNPNNLPQVNHIDENPLNNRADNLEWCTALYNNRYGTAIVRKVETVSTPVAQYTLSGKCIAIYRSARIASELLNIPRKGITHAASKGTKCDNYYWAYPDYNFSSNDRG